MIPEKYQKYLPSKKFVIITSVIIVLVVLIFVIFFMPSSGENFGITGNKQALPVVIGNPTLPDLIQRDTDGDGVPDWEEALWGTDPHKKITFNDTPDATYIANKKKELKIEGNVTADTTKLTETEKFAREFFTSYSAMKSSGQIDKNAINDFSSALGQNITNPTLVDRYTETDVKINAVDNPASKQKYYFEVKALFKKYQSAGLGSELDLVSQALASNSADGTSGNTSQYDKLPAIASAYQNFAQKVMGLSVPQSLAIYHLRIANSSNNTGISVSNMGKIAADPIVGLSGLSQYQKYSDDLVKAVADLEAFLLKQ
ncbi:MAG: thrombospondin type 3 repeat-containing protein [Candidatus Nomurabacteria bacterium]|nr:thrombospondin type 3 repeat-containing protein [Candidatus Nomurabacteria bacterium]